MKKILFIFNGYSSRMKGASGGETHSIFFIDYLNKHEYDIYICCPQRYFVLKQIKNVRSLVYPSLPFEEKMYENLSLLFFIYCYRIIISIFKINRVKADIIVSSSHLFHDIVPLYFSSNKNLTFVTYIHHIISEQERKGVSFFITRFLEKISFYVIKKINSIVFTDSKINRVSLINKYDFEEKFVHVIKNGIDLNFIDSIKVTREPIYDVCFCGRLHKTKGVYDLINIIKIIKKSYPNITCAIIGQGGEKNNLEKIIKNSDLEKNIKLLGFVSEKEKIETMKLSKIFVLPSHEEGWGIVIGEAMACGLPVIVYKLKDITGIWKDNVIWIDCFNLNKFSYEVIMLLRDNEKRQIFIKKSFKFSETLGWNNILENESMVINKNHQILG